jgi:hypothetical protein
MPARMTEIGVGAWTCASGSQVWNGKTGTLIAKATNRNQKTQVVNFIPTSIPAKGRWEPVSFPAWAIETMSGIEKVPLSMRSATTATSIRIEPASVYRKNLIAAYSRRGPPQMPMRKYIGRSMISQ